MWKWAGVSDLPWPRRGPIVHLIPSLHRPLGTDCLQCPAIIQAMINQPLASGFRRTSAENRKVSPISTHRLRHQRFLQVETAEHQKMKPCWQIELWCSKPQLILGFRLKRSFPETIRLSEARRDAQLPRAVSQPQGAAPAVPSTMPRPGTWAVVASLPSPASVYSPTDSNSCSWALARGLLGRKQ